MSKLQQIYQLYHGSGTLELSTSPNEYLIATVANIALNPVCRTTSEANISFILSPFAYLKNDTLFSYTASDVQYGSDYTFLSRLLNTKCTAPTEPTIRLKFTASPHADIKIRIRSNNQNLYLIIPEEYSRNEIVIDSNLRHIYAITDDDIKISLNTSITSQGYTFPVFPGREYGATGYNADIYLRCWLDELHDGSFAADYTRYIEYFEVKCNARNF